MKQIIKHSSGIMLLLLALLLPQLAGAQGFYDFKVDGLCYSINFDGESVIVSNEVGGAPSYNYLVGDITIPSSVTYGGKTYAVTGINAYAFRGCLYIKSATIANSITYIPDGAFYNCKGLEWVQLGDAVTTLNNYAFAWCSGLKRIYIPQTLNKISHDVFLACRNLEHVTIPKNVYFLGGNAFAGCNGMKSITCFIENPRGVLGDNLVFDEIDKGTCILKVPGASIDDYKSTAYWKDFQNIFKIGDVNRDDAVNASDITVLYNIMLNGDNAFPITSDVNGDLSVNANDLTYLYNIMLGDK